MVPQPPTGMQDRLRPRGFTLVELVMVLLVLTFLAGMLVTQIDSFTGDESGVDGGTPRSVATRTTMRMIRNSIMGSGGKPGAWADLGQRQGLFIKEVDDLLLEGTEPEFALKYPGVTAYDPFAKTGWRGPYALASGGSIRDAWGNPLVIEDLTGDEQNMLLRSAGRDGTLGNDDDITLMIRGVQP